MKSKIIIFLLSLFLIGEISLKGQNGSTGTVTGTVTDETGETMIGVNLLVKNTLKGTVSDFDGNFSLSAGANDTISVTFIGYKPQVIPVSGRTVINVQMESSATDLDEYVVVAYGEVKRANLTGAVSSLQAADIQDIPATNLTELLEGRMPGVNVDPAQPSGLPGSPNRVTIRGESTFGTPGVGAKDRSPLYIVDNFEMSQEQFDALDPSEIESISVLKDASASVYGSKGANGVVLVKTKRGKEGKLVVNYSGSFGIMDATQQTEMLSAYDHARMLNDRYKDGTDWIPISNEEMEAMKGQDYNWLDQAWQPSLETRHTVNLSGGSEKVSYFVGGTYKYVNGNFPELGVGSYSTRFGLDAELIKGLKASITISTNSKDFKRPYLSGTGTSTMEGIFLALLQAPKWTPSHIDGLPVANNVSVNPFAMWESESFKQDVDKATNMQVRLVYEFQNIQGLRATAQYSRNESHGYSKTYQVPYELYEFYNEGDYNYILSNRIKTIVPVKNNDRIAESYGYSQRYQLNLSLNYNRSFGKHDISSFLTYEQFENNGYGFKATAEQMLIPGIQTQKGFNWEAAESDGNLNEGGEIGSVFRLNYAYDNKYLFEGTLRYETTTVFSPDEREGLFPAMSIGWVISEEGFAKNNLDFFDFMKLRFSSGISGFDSATPFQYNVNYTPSSGYLFGGSNASTGLTVQGKTNGVKSTGVSWEKSFQNNMGIDLKFLNNRFSVSADAFYYYNYDILDTRTVELPVTSGIQEMPAENVGELQVWGYDMSIGYHGNIGKDFKWDIAGVFAFSSNRIVKAPTQYKSNDFRYPIGQSTFAEGREEGYISNGIIRTQEQLDQINAEWQEKWGRNYTIEGKEVVVGSLYLQDIGRPGLSTQGEPERVFGEPDGLITIADMTYVQRVNDKLVWKNLLPTSVNLGANWKGVNVSTLWTMAWGVSNKVVDKEARKAPTPEKNTPSFWADYYTPENTDAAYPTPFQDNAKWNEWVSTFWMKDIYQVRLRFLNVSYSIPKKVTKNWGIEDVRVFFVGKNLWSPVTTFDYKEDAIARYNTYPFTKSFNFGLNMKF